MTVSIYCIVAAMCALPCSILERCFATLYLKDYETNQRPYISYCLVFLLNLLGGIGALILQNSEYSILNNIMVFWNFRKLHNLCCHRVNSSEHNRFVGEIAYVEALVSCFFQLNIFLRGWNKRKYKECHSSSTVRFSRIGKYSLAKRFQISENIKSLHVGNACSWTCLISRNFRCSIS